MKLSDLTDHDTVSAQRRAADPEYAAESDRLAAASELSVIIVDYRARHGISQTELGRQLGWKQPQVARLESGDHLPNLATLRTLARHKIVSMILDDSGLTMTRPAAKKQSTAKKKPRATQSRAAVKEQQASRKAAAARRAASKKTTHRSTPAAARVKSHRG